MACYRFRIIVGKELQHADVPHLVGLLCTRSKRPRSRRTAEKRDELAPLHVPTARTTLCAIALA